MAGAEGNKFLFFSLVFFGFMFLILSQPGASSYLTGSTPVGVPTNYTVGNETSMWDYGEFFVQHPFSENAMIGWLIVAIFLVDLYIIATSIIP